MDVQQPHIGKSATLRPLPTPKPKESKQTQLAVPGPKISGPSPPKKTVPPVPVKTKVTVPLPEPNIVVTPDSSSGHSDSHTIEHKKDAHDTLNQTHPLPLATLKTPIQRAVSDLGAVPHSHPTNNSSGPPRRGPPLPPKSGRPPIAQEIPIEPTPHSSEEEPVKTRGERSNLTYGNAPFTQDGHQKPIPPTKSQHVLAKRLSVAPFPNSHSKDDMSLPTHDNNRAHSIPSKLVHSAQVPNHPTQPVNIPLPRPVVSPPPTLSTASHSPTTSPTPPRAKGLPLSESLPSNSGSPGKSDKVDKADKANMRKMFGSTSSGSLANSAAMKLKRLSTMNFGKGITKMFGKQKDVSADRVAEYLKELEKDGKSMTLIDNIASEIAKMDKWSTKIVKPPDWSNIEVDEQQANPQIRGLLNISRAKPEGFRFEFGKKGIQHLHNGHLDYLDNDIEYYRDLMAPFAHVNLLSPGDEENALGAACLSYDDPKEVGDDELRAILRTKKGTTRFMIPPKIQHKNDILKHVSELFPEISTFKFTKIPLPDFPAKLAEYDSQLIVRKYKFGVLYVRDGQTEENDMFSNNDPSPEFEEFLEFLGQKIELKGWSKYRGGLDVKNNTTGTHSIYTEFGGFEVMFHVSTMLPFQPDDLQRVERKRHLGNDIVQIMFKEGDTPFDPLCLKTHFNNIFVVVSVDHALTKSKGKTHYKIVIANKTGVPAYGPYLVDPPIFPKSDEFRHFFLTKMINSERSAMIGPDFKGKTMRTCKQLLDDMAKEWIPKAKERRKTDMTTSSSLASNSMTSSPSVISASPSLNSSASVSMSPPGSPIIGGNHAPTVASSPSMTNANNVVASSPSLNVVASSPSMTLVEGVVPVEAVSSDSSGN